MKVVKTPINFVDSVHHLDRQWSECIILSGNFTLTVVSGRTGWRPDCQAIIWNSSTLHEGIFNDPTCWHSFWGGESLGMWPWDVLLHNHWFAFLLSAPGPQPDLLVLLHAAHQPFGERAELRHLHPPTYADTHEQSADGDLGHHFHR